MRKSIKDAVTDKNRHIFLAGIGALLAEYYLFYKVLSPELMQEFYSDSDISEYKAQVALLAFITTNLAVNYYSIYSLFARATYPDIYNPASSDARKYIVTDWIAVFYAFQGVWQPVLEKLTDNCNANNRFNDTFQDGIFWGRAGVLGLPGVPQLDYTITSPEILFESYFPLLEGDITLAKRYLFPSIVFSITNEFANIIVGLYVYKKFVDILRTKLQRSFPGAIRYISAYTKPKGAEFYKQQKANAFWWCTAITLGLLVYTVYKFFTYPEFPTIQGVEPMLNRLKELNGSQVFEVMNAVASKSSIQVGGLDINAPLPAGLQCQETVLDSSAAATSIMDLKVTANLAAAFASNYSWLTPYIVQLATDELRSLRRTHLEICSPRENGFGVRQVPGRQVIDIQISAYKPASSPDLDGLNDLYDKVELPKVLHLGHDIKSLSLSAKIDKKYPADMLILLQVFEQYFYLPEYLLLFVASTRFIYLFYMSRAASVVNSLETDVVNSLETDSTGSRLLVPLHDFSQVECKSSPKDRGAENPKVFEAKSKYLVYFYLLQICAVPVIISTYNTGSITPTLAFLDLVVRYPFNVRSKFPYSDLQNFLTVLPMSILVVFSSTAIATVALYAHSQYKKHKDPAHNERGVGQLGGSPSSSIVVAF